jgi:rod shape-determining protein MreB
MYFHNLTNVEKEQILDYKLMVYFCEGNDKEKLDWFKTINIAGEKLNQDIITYVRDEFKILLGERTAEEVKIALGNAHQSVFVVEENGEKKVREKVMVVRGRDMENGLPRSLKITSSEVREALLPVLQEITSAAADLIEETPPELVSDILERGIILAGGGSMIAGIDKLMSEETRMPVYIADDPMTAVVRGCGKVLDDLALLNRVKVVGGLR